MFNRPLATTRNLAARHGARSAVSKAHNRPTYCWLLTTTAGNANIGILLRSVCFRRRELPGVYLRYRFRFPLALGKNCLHFRRLESIFV
jgi:hypothetical protein